MANDMRAAPPPSYGAISDDAYRYGEVAWSRNRGLISECEQIELARMQVLVAGCGSVGGAVVEPLVRLGAGTLVLADPDVYELHNINRQSCGFADVGRRKAEVLAERARSINPFVSVQALGDGLDELSVIDEVSRATVVFDGVDVSPRGIRVKYLLHEQAAARRIPVVSGADLGGKPTVFAFDYRRDQRPLYGRGDATTFTPGNDIAAARALVGLRNLPRHFLPVVRRSAETGAPWPQVVYTAQALGGIAVRVMLDMAMGRRVRDVVSVDLHQLTRPRSERIADRVRWPLDLARTVNALRRMAHADSA
jgi:hypothetical protein